MTSKYIIQKINNQIVKPTIKNNVINNNNDISDSKYPNIFVVGKKGSGKSQCVVHMLNYFMKKNKDLLCVLFSNTHDKDDIWIKTKKKFNDRIIPYSSLNDDDAFNTFIDYLKNGADKDEEYIIIFDDFSNELKDRRLSHFYKQNRHFKAITITSSQQPLDLDTNSRTQINIWCLFPLLSEDKLEQIHRSAGLSIDFDKFLDMYKAVTSEKYNFLYIDADKDSFRKNFNEKIIINDSDLP